MSLYYKGSGWVGCFVHAYVFFSSLAQCVFILLWSYTIITPRWHPHLKTTPPLGEKKEADIFSISHTGAPSVFCCVLPPLGWGSWLCCLRGWYWISSLQFDNILRVLLIALIFLWIGWALCPAVYESFIPFIWGALTGFVKFSCWRVRQSVLFYRCVAHVIWTWFLGRCLPLDLLQTSCITQGTIS